MGTEPINIHNQYLSKRCTNIRKTYKFEEKTYSSARITEGTVLDASYELFFNLTVIQITII